MISHSFSVLIVLMIISSYIFKCIVFVCFCSRLSNRCSLSDPLADWPESLIAK